MAKKNNKECAVCHKIYSYCPNCDEYAHAPYWMNMFCSEQCLNVYEILSKYVSGVATQEWAKTRLESIDIDEKSLKGSFAKEYAEIMHGNKKVSDTNNGDKDIEKKVATEMKETVISNATAEARAIYPKSVKNKKRY